jgi:hypothetical protein
MPKTPTTPAEFIASLPPDRRETLAALDSHIRQAMPELKPRLWGKMIGYGQFTYTSGRRETSWFIIGLANGKSHISIYVSATDEGGYLVEQNLKQLGKVTGGRSCINVKHVADLNLPAFSVLIKQAARKPGMLGTSG